jgi:AraC-like DNA-binding protein
MKALKHFKKVSDYHKIANISGPEHPLISLVDYSRINYPKDTSQLTWKQDYYTIGLKRNVAYKLFYGHKEYDFDEGIMTFVAPNQVMSLTENPNVKGQQPSGWLLLIHPDFLWNTSLAKRIAQYDFFGYSVNEALFLSEKEEQMMLELLNNIQREYQSNIDQFSQKIIIAQVDLLLSYAERFYERQFITRKIVNHEVLNRLENLLVVAFNEEKLLEQGVPTVQQVAEELNLSPNYLSNMLKSLTGQSTQQHIHNKLIAVAKEQLSTTQLSVSEIAYNLGFEYPASFTKLFKSKTDLSPMAFRKEYN